MSGSQPATTTNVTETRLPAWVDKAGEDNYDTAVNIGKKPLVQYSRPTVAPMSQATHRANEYFNMNKDAGQAETNAASGFFKESGLLADDAAKVARQFNNADYMISKTGQYLNPYLSEVEDKALDVLDRSKEMSLMANSDKAAAASAFGGSRHGIIDAVTNSETAREAGIMSAGIRKEGYDTAAGLARGDMAASMGGLLGSAGVKQGAGTGMLGSAASTRNIFENNVETARSIGTQNEVRNQARINGKIANFNEARDKDINDLNLRLTALGMSPYSSSSSSSGTSTPASSGTDWAMGGLGLLQLFAGLSEDTEKEDIKDLGPIDGTPLNMYAYRYKGDPKSYPKVVGVMASEVEKFLPDAVHKVNGKRVIDYGMLGEAI